MKSFANFVIYVIIVSSIKMIVDTYEKDIQSDSVLTVPF